MGLSLFVSFQYRDTTGDIAFVKKEVVDIKKKRKLEKLISLLVACLCVVNLVGCNKIEEQQVSVETFETYKNTQEKAIEHNLALINTEKQVKDYEQNIVYGWAIKQARTAEENTTNPIIITDINNTDKLWEAYVIPNELEAYACSYKNTLNDVYIVEVLKPKNEYIETVEKSIIGSSVEPAVVLICN